MNANVYTTPPAAGELNASWYGGCQIETWRQRCTLVSGSDRFTLGYRLPARSMVIAASITVQTAATVTGDGTAVADSVAIWNGGTVGTGTAATASGTNALGVLLATVKASNTGSANAGFIMNQLNGSTAVTGARNTDSATQFVHVIPYSTTSQRISLVTGTVGMYFGTSSNAGTNTSTTACGVVDVTITVAKFSLTGV